MTYLVLLFAANSAACQFGLEFEHASDTVAVILATALPDSFAVHELPNRKWSAGKPVLPLTGYRFRVDRIAGGTTNLRVGDTFIAVPWDYDGECRTIKWTMGRWVPIGAEGVLTVRRTRLHRGQTVIDVSGWHEPYPHGEQLDKQFDYKPRSQWPTAREFYAKLTSR